MSSPFYVVTLPVLPFYMGCPEEMLSFARHTNLCIHNSENYMFLELFLFSCIPTILYQLIAKSMCAFVFINALLFLWSVKPFYSGMTRRNKLQYLIHIQDWVKVVVPRRSKCQPSFCPVLPWSITIFYIGIIIGIAHHPMNSWYSDTSCHHCSFLGFHVIVTGMPISVL